MSHQMRKYHKIISLLLLSVSLVSFSVANSYAGFHLGLASAIKAKAQELKDEKEKQHEASVESTTINNAPVISSLTANSASISSGSAVTITCSASDLDNEERCRRGYWNPKKFQ